MNQIHDLPPDSTFGESFNYAAWTPGTVVQLANVPWGADYRDVVHFDTAADRNAYIAANSLGPHYTFENMTYVRPGRPIRVDMPFHAVNMWNYLKVYNPKQPISGNGAYDFSRTFYYFITNVEYIAPNTTEIHVQLDVWQSYVDEVQFGNCYVERGHIGIANAANYDDNGRTWLTVPEGLDVGNEYVIAKTWEYDLVNIRNAGTQDDYGVIVASTTEIMPDSGTVDAPKLQSAMGSRFESLPNGCALYYFDSPVDFENFQVWVSPKPWVSQGIISVTVVPRLVGGLGVTLPAKWDMGQGNNFTAYRLSGNVPTIPAKEIVLAQNFRSAVALPDRYKNLYKFFTYPYSVIELGTYSGNPLILKPECINRPDLRIQQLSHVAPPSPRIAFYPLGYNAPKGDVTPNSGEFLSMQTGIFDLPTFSVVNNGYLSYMASNRNAIAYQHSSAEWSQQRALQGSGAEYANAMAGVGHGISATDIANKTAINSLGNANATAGWRALQGGANAAMNGASHGATPADRGINAGMGALNAIGSYAIETNDNNNRTAIALQANNANRQNDTSYGVGVADTNRAYAQFAAKGDYANNIAGINARVQDAKLIQPTTSGQIGGDAFNLATYKWAVYARLKMLQPAVMRAIGEYWLRYGYAVNTFGKMPPDYQCMTRFTYWKLHETYISGASCPESFKQTLRGIFEKGVTVWKNPDDMGMIDIADNDPLSGVAL